MALIANTKFAQDLLGVRNVHPSASDIFDPYCDMKTLTTLNLNKAIILKHAKGSTGASGLFYQSILNLFGFDAKDIKLKFTRSHIQVSAKNKRQGANKNDFLKLEYRRKIKIPEGAVISQAFVYLTNEGNLVIKLPVKDEGFQNYYPVRLLNVNAFHKRLSEALRFKSKEINDKHSVVKFILNMPENIDNDDEVNVSVAENKLVVRAETNPDRQKYCKYYKTMELPDYVDCNKLEWHKHGKEIEIAIPISMAAAE